MVTATIWESATLLMSAEVWKVWRTLAPGTPVPSWDKYSSTEKGNVTPEAGPMAVWNETR